MIKDGHIRNKDFNTTNQKFTVESGAGEEGTKQLSYKYKEDTPKQLTNGKPESNMKRQKFVPETIIDEDVPAFMGALAQAAKDGKKEFEFGGKTFKVKLKKDVADKITKNMDESEELDDLFVDSLISDLVEAAASDYAKLSDDELRQLFGIFSNVGRSAAAPILKAIKRELAKRSIKEETIDLEEAVFYRDIRHAIELLKTTPAAVKFRDLIAKKDQDTKISASDLKKAKEIFANPNDKDKANIKKKRNDRYFPRFGVRALEEESVDLEEGKKVVASVELWNGKKMKKSFAKQSAAEAWVKKMEDNEDVRDYKMHAESTDLEEAKQMKYDKVIKKLKDGEWDTSMDVKQRMHLTYTDNKTGKKKVVFVESDDLEEAIKWWTVTITKKAGKLFKGQTVDVKARNSAEAIKKGIKQMKGDPMTVPSGSVDAVLGESNDLEEAIKVKTHRGMYSIKKGEESLKSWVEKIVIMSDAVKKNQRATITKNIVKAIESGKIKNADLTQGLTALLGVRAPSNMEAPNNVVRSELKDRKLLESTDLEEAALPFKELEKAWIRTKGNDKKREKLIKKHDLKPIISNVRPGAIKLGPLNALNAKGKQNHTMAGLDVDGELIFISNNPTRIHYPSNVKDRPKGEEMKESVSLETLRLRKVIQLSVNESDEKLIDSFIAESNVDISWAPSKIANTFNKFTREL